VFPVPLVQTRIAALFLGVWIGLAIVREDVPSGPRQLV
jgi:hypothetical protein